MDKIDVKEVVNTIIGFLLSITGNEISKSWLEKAKIKKIIKKDRKNIKCLFYANTETELFKLTEQFIILQAFKNTTFYSPSDLTESEENELWESFKNFLNKEQGNYQSEVNPDFKQKIIQCINLHNKEINKIILELQQELPLKKLHKDHEAITDKLNDIIDTLNINAQLCNEDSGLEFVICQIESILKSYRVDIDQLRKQQLLFISLVILSLLIIVFAFPIYFKHLSNNMNGVSVVVIFYLIFLIISFFFVRSISQKLHLLETEMYNMRKELSCFHSRTYSNFVRKHCPSPNYADRDALRQILIYSEIAKEEAEKSLGEHTLITDLLKKNSTSLKEIFTENRLP